MNFQFIIKNWVKSEKNVGFFNGDIFGLNAIRLQNLKFWDGNGPFKN